MSKKKTRKKRSSVAAGIGSEINEAVKKRNLLMGSNSVFKELKKGGLGKVICASNLPSARKKDLNHYASVSGIEVKEFDGDSAMLGETCGKPFSILLIGIKK